MTLLVEGIGIDEAKIMLEKFVEGNESVIIVDFDGFGVARLAGLEVFILGESGGAVAIADGGIKDAFELFKVGFHAPEATPSEVNGLFHSTILILTDKDYLKDDLFFLPLGKSGVH